MVPHYIKTIAKVLQFIQKIRQGTVIIKKKPTIARVLQYKKKSPGYIKTIGRVLQYKKNNRQGTAIYKKNNRQSTAI